MRNYFPRLALGAIFLIAGLNGFFSFLPEMSMSNAGSAFIDSLKSSGYVWALINTVEIVAGTLLLFNVMGQLAVLLLAPICLGIFMFHTMYSIEGSTLAWVAIALELTMIFIWRKNFLAMFREFRDTDKRKPYEKTPMSFATGGHHASGNIFSGKNNGFEGVNMAQEGEMLANRPKYRHEDPQAEA